MYNPATGRFSLRETLSAGPAQESFKFGPAGMIPVPEDLLTNCCFGGPDLRTLYVTAGRTLHRTTVAVPGYHAFPCSA